MDTGAFSLFASSLFREGMKITVCADQRELARTHPGVLCASGSAVVIIRSVEPQMPQCSACRCSF